MDDENEEAEDEEYELNYGEEIDGEGKPNITSRRSQRLMRLLLFLLDEEEEDGEDGEEDGEGNFPDHVRHSKTLD